MSYKEYDIKSLFAVIGNEENKEAFHELFRRYYAISFEFALLFVKDHSLAEDVVSETFLKLYLNRIELGKIKQFESYLFVSIKNHSLNYLKKNQRWFNFGFLERPESLSLTDDRNPEKEYIEEELREAISQCVSQLPPKRRMIFQLIKDEGLKYKEVAELLGISVNTVENHLDLAVKSLKKTVEKYINEKEAICPATRKVVP